MELSGPVMVAGAGGFIGGALVAELRRRGVLGLRTVDSKPLDQWAQCFGDVENVRSDLSKEESCVRAVAGDIQYVFNLAADMGGMGFIERNSSMHAFRPD